MVKLKAQAGRNLGGFSFDGINYLMEDGIIEVPPHAVETAFVHGYELVPPDDLKAKPSPNIEAAREKLKRMGKPA